MDLIIPAKHAAERASECHMHFDCAHHLAQYMRSIPSEQKRAAGRTILMHWRYALASSQAAAFWRAKGGR